MAYELRLLGKCVTAWRDSSVKGMQIGHTGVSNQTKVNSKGQIREKFHVTLLPQYQIILHSRKNQSATAKHSQLSKTVKISHIIIIL